MSYGKASRRAAVGIFLVWLIGVQASGHVLAATFTFFDDFNRADGPVGNGWSNMDPSELPEPIILGGKLTSLDLSAVGAGNEIDGIYRPIPIGRTTTASAIGTEIIAPNFPFGPYRSRFVNLFLIGSNGGDESGYGVAFARSGTGFPSVVQLLLDGVVLDTLFTPFQYDRIIEMSVAWYDDGRILGSVTEGGNNFDFTFGPRAVTLSGNNFLLTMGIPDNRDFNQTFATVDNVSITVEVPEPSTIGLFGWFCSALFRVGFKTYPVGLGSR